MKKNNQSYSWLDNDAYYNQYWSSSTLKTVSQPAYWVLDDKKEKYSLSFNIPGFGPEDVKVEVEDSVICFKIKGAEYNVSYPNFYSGEEELSVSVKNGVITFSLPVVKPKKREIKVS